MTRQWQQNKNQQQQHKQREKWPMTTKRQEHRPRSNAGKESGVGRIYIWEKTLTPAIPISVVGDLCFDACFSQLEPKPPSGGQTEKTRETTGNERERQEKKETRMRGGERLAGINARESAAPVY
jgi:hypothetical protein